MPTPFDQELMLSQPPLQQQYFAPMVDHHHQQQPFDHHQQQLLVPGQQPGVTAPLSIFVNKVCMDGNKGLVFGLVSISTVYSFKMHNLIYFAFPDSSTVLLYNVASPQCAETLPFVFDQTGLPACKVDFRCVYRYMHAVRFVFFWPGGIVIRDAECFFCYINFGVFANVVVSAYKKGGIVP